MPYHNGKLFVPDLHEVKKNIYFLMPRWNSEALSNTSHARSHLYSFVLSEDVSYSMSQMQRKQSYAA